jgi:hypothetical protein
VSGAVHDFEAPDTRLAGSVSISTAGLVPVPTITTQGATFTLDGVPENSAFQILASSPPTHRQTYNTSITVTVDDLADVKAYAVSETFLAATAAGFGQTPSAAKGVVLMRLVDGMGMPKAGVASSNIVLAGATGAAGPFVLGEDLAPMAGATTTSASGWVAFFEVPAGVTSLGQAATATVTLTMASSPVGAGVVTLADVVVVDMPPPMLPTNVSFSTTVFPIFTNRGCVACHSGNGPGKQLGGLMLDASANVAFRELTEENPLRANRVMPEMSLVLTRPSAESPPDRHPNVTFASPTDPDYLKILVWIREGAKEN